MPNKRSYQLLRFFMLVGILIAANSCKNNIEEKPTAEQIQESLQQVFTTSVIESFESNEKQWSIDQIPFVETLDSEYPLKSIQVALNLKESDSITINSKLYLKIINPEGMFFSNEKDTIFRSFKKPTDAIISKPSKLPPIEFQLYSTWDDFDLLKLVPITMYVYYSNENPPVNYTYETKIISYATDY